MMSSRIPILFACLWLAPVALEPATLVAANATEGSATNVMVLEGPAYQHARVTVRYYQERQLAREVTVGMSLQAGRVEESLEEGFDGVEIYLQSAAAPVTVNIQYGSHPPEQATLEESGVVRLSAGQAGRAAFEAESIELTEAEASLVDALIAAYDQQSSTRQWVADAAEANIEPATLEVYLRELRRVLGPPRADLQPRHRGWMAWNAVDGTRSLAGALDCQSGSCGLQLSVREGQILDLLPQCPLLPDDYFGEPVDASRHFQLAEQLTRSLFDGNAKRAHSLYAARFQSQVTVEQLAALSDRLRQNYGQRVQSIQPGRVQLTTYDPQRGGLLMHVDSAVKLDSGARCISRVTFSILCGHDRVGKADLGAVNVFQVFSSAHPELAKATENLLRELPKGLSAKFVVGSYPPELQAVAQTDRTQAMLDRLASRLHGHGPEWDFDLWTMNSLGNVVQAAGPVQFGDQDCFMEIQFLGDRLLLGFSVYGPATAESTLGYFSFDPTLGKTAQRFWTLLLQEKPEAAHAMLDQEFQRQFPLETMKAQLAEPQQQTAPLQEVLVDSIRVTQHTYRPLPLMASVFLTARFQNGETLPLACELGWPSAAKSAKLSIFDFSNAFQIDFPVEAIALADSSTDGALAAIRAFEQFSADDVLALIEPDKRQAIDRAALSAYLRHLQHLAGQWTQPTWIARTVEYEEGEQRFRCNAILTADAGERFPLEVWFHRGYLERFTIAHPEMHRFTRWLDDNSELERRLRAFVNSWFEDLEGIDPQLAHSVDRPAMRQQLQYAREEFLSEHGELQEVEVKKRHPFEGSNLPEFEVTLKGVNGQKIVTVAVEIGAFGGLVLGLDF